MLGEQDMRRSPWPVVIPCAQQLSRSTLKIAPSPRNLVSKHPSVPSNGILVASTPGVAIPGTEFISQSVTRS
jgi:hypothetical protein